MRLERVCDMTGDERLENREFFKGKRVLVTGHTGFKGAWLSAVLNFMGAEAAGYALKAQQGSLYEKICGDELIHSITGDLLDSCLLEQTVKELQPEIVIHLAGFGRRQDCLADPERTFQTNMIGSTFLMEALRKCPSVKSIVLESLSRSFEDESGSMDYNDEVLDGADPYDSSKICMEYMARDYRELYFQTDSRMTGVAVVRSGRVSGGMVHDKSVKADNAVMHIENDSAGDGYIQAGNISSALDTAAEESCVGIHRLILPECRQPVLDVLDGYLSVSRLLYEEPTAYAGEWNIEPRQNSKSGLLCEQDTGQAEEFFKCRIDGKTAREICMRRISQYYSNACMNVCHS